MNIDKRIESIKPHPKRIREGDPSHDLYLIVKELNNKLEVLEDNVIELKNTLQQIQLIQEGKDV